MAIHMDTDMETDMYMVTEMDMEWTWNQQLERAFLQKNNGYESARRKKRSSNVIQAFVQYFHSLSKNEKEALICWSTD
jgi:hypothetical protein